MGHLRKLSRSAHPEAWAARTKRNRVRLVMQRMAAFGGFDRVSVSTVFKKLQASGVFLEENTPSAVKPSRAADGSAGTSFIQKGKGLFKKVANALKGGDR